MLRNKDFKNFLFIFLIYSLISFSIAILIDFRFSIFVLISNFILFLLFYIFTKKRYKDIEKISEEIDYVLHNEDGLYISDFSEGELSILENEVRKMTLRIREQNNELKKEKENLSDFLFNIAHQLRTPLTSINLLLSLLEKNPEINQRKKLIKEIEVLLVQMDWLLTTLLKISRLDAGIVEFKSEKINLKNLIDTATKSFLIQMDIRNINLEIDTYNDIYIKGDFNWLVEAIQNIIKNCIENLSSNGFIKINVNDNPLYTEILIHDSGSGFKKEEINYIFNRFHRGNSGNTSGYGIGMDLSKRILNSQNAIISAKNHIDGGALFIIRFSK